MSVVERWLHRTLVLCAVVGAAEVAYLVGSAVAQDPAQDPVPRACLTIRAAGDSGVFVNLGDSETPQTIAHVRAAVAAGEARILHWRPSEANTNRRAALRGHPARTGFDRDEYPPASSDEGGAGASVEYIGPTDNRRAGQRLGAVMSPYCEGTPFIIEP